MAVTLNALPRHVAIIMDGNGRWAKAHALKVALGHHNGMDAMKGIIRETSDLGIEALSMYAFSTENWSRSTDEVSALLALMSEGIAKNLKELIDNHARIRILGNVDAMPERQRRELRMVEEATKDQTGLKLNVGVNYGSRDEIVMAARTLAQRVQKGELRPEDIDRAAFESALYTHDLPDVDLLIRTSGEMRISNFLLYQCAYAEMVFPEVLWPDFTVEEYHKVLDIYAHRDRRYGGRKK